MILPDVNVLIYAVDTASGNHSPARRCVEDALNGDAGLGFTWPALTGFLLISIAAIRPAARG